VSASHRSEEERLSPEEFARGLARIQEHFKDPKAGEDTRELAAWFLRRYPSLVERCRYVTRRTSEIARGSRIPRERLE
jgi:hypothetical protein